MWMVLGLVPWEVWRSLFDVLYAQCLGLLMRPVALPRENLQPVA
jgi:hypothetical protein